MKRWGIIGLMVIVALVSATAASAATKLTLIVNGKVSNAETKLIDGVTYVPLRAAAELLGSTVNFDAATSTITITGKEASTAAVQGALKSFNVDVNVEAGPMAMDITKVTFDPAYKEYSFASETTPAIILDVKVENTSNDALTWFLDQTQVVLNTKEQIEDTLSSDARITSEFNGKVVKTGKVVFPVKSSKLEDITTLRLLVKYVMDEEWNTIAEDQEVEIVLK